MREKWEDIEAQMLMPHVKRGQYIRLGAAELHKYGPNVNGTYSSWWLEGVGQFIIHADYKPQGEGHLIGVPQDSDTPEQFPYVQFHLKYPIRKASNAPDFIVVHGDEAYLGVPHRTRFEMEISKWKRGINAEPQSLSVARNPKTLTSIALLLK